MKIGIIGLGAIGGMHAKNIREGKIPNCELVCACDEKLSDTKKFDGLKIYGNVDEMLSSGGIDSVIVATPSFNHYALAKKCLEAGKNVLVEKPISLNSLDARRLSGIAKECGKLCAVMLNQRTTPVYSRVKELVASGELGKINRVSWFMTNWYRPQIYFSSSPWKGTWKGEAGGALINQAIHNIDIFTWVFGLPKNLRAWCKFGKYHDIEVEDEATAFMEYDENMSAVFCVCTGEHPGSNRLEIAADKAFIRAEDDKLTISRFESLRDYTMGTKYVFGSPDTSFSEEIFEGKGEQHIGVLKDFVEAVEGKKICSYDASEAYASVCLANAMLYSSWKNSDVSFPFDDEAYAQILEEKILSSKFRENPDSDFILEFSKSFR